jgi:hypothetical protein
MSIEIIELTVAYGALLVLAALHTLEYKPKAKALCCSKPRWQCACV